SRRHLQHHRSVPRFPASRHRRRRRQVLRAEVRCLHHLHHHDRGADLAAAGPVRPRDGALRTRMAQPLTNDITRYLAERVRWHPLEIAFWLAALASIFLLPNKHLILTEIAILALFALSLVLILGYSGIISLGHAAYFGFGGYVAGLLAKHGIITEPVLALIVSGLAATVLGFVTSFLVLRGSDLTRLMVTLGVSLVLREVANQLDWLTGGGGGVPGIVLSPVPGPLAFVIPRPAAYLLWL